MGSKETISSTDQPNSLRSHPRDILRLYEARHPDRFADIIDGLPDESRGIFEASYYDGLLPGEIQEKFNVKSIASVKARISKAKKTICGQAGIRIPALYKAVKPPEDLRTDLLSGKLNGGLILNGITYATPEMVRRYYEHRYLRNVNLLSSVKKISGRKQTLEEWARLHPDEAKEKANTLLRPGFARLAIAKLVEGLSDEEILERFNITRETLRDEGLRAKVALASSLGLVIPERIARERSYKAKEFLAEAKKSGGIEGAINLISLWPGTATKFTRLIEGDINKSLFLTHVCDEINNVIKNVAWEGAPDLHHAIRTVMEKTFNKMYSSFPSTVLSRESFFREIEEDKNGHMYISELSSWQQDIFFHIKSGETYEQIQLMYPESKISSLRNAFFKARKSLEEKIAASQTDDEIMKVERLLRYISETNKEVSPKVTIDEDVKDEIFGEIETLSVSSPKLAAQDGVTFDYKAADDTVKNSNPHENISLSMTEFEAGVKKSLLINPIRIDYPTIYKAANRDLEATGRVLDGLHKGVYKYIYWMVADVKPIYEMQSSGEKSGYSLTEDLTENVLGKIVSELMNGKYDPNNGSFVAFAFGICYAEVKKYKQQGKREFVDESDFILKGFKDEERSVVVLRSLGCSNQEISKTIGRGEEDVSKVYFRVAKELAQRQKIA